MVGSLDWVFAEYRDDRRFRKLDAGTKHNHEKRSSPRASLPSSTRRSSAASEALPAETASCSCKMSAALA
jgi:hypothetical protein